MKADNVWIGGTKKLSIVMTMVDDDDDANSDDGDEDGRCLDWQQEVAKTECRLLGSPGRLTDLKH